MAQNVQLFQQSTQAQVMQMVTHQKYLQLINHQRAMMQLGKRQETQHQQQLFPGPPAMAPAPTNHQPSKARAMMMMATKIDFLNQVAPKCRCRRKNYNSEYEEIGKTELKYETQRQSVEAESQTRAAKSARSTKPCGNATMNIIMNPTSSLVPFGGRELR